MFWREVKAEEEDAEFRRTTASVGDAGDSQNRYGGCRGEDGECLQSDISDIILLAYLSARQL